MSNKLHTAFSLSIKEWGLLLQIWLLLLITDLSLRFFPYAMARRRLTHSLRPTTRTPRGTNQPQTTIQRYNRLVNLACRYHLYPMTCLRHTLVLQWLLARRGILTDLRFGTCKESGLLRAHAWLEYQGTPISEKQVIEGRFFSLLPRL